MAKNKAREAVQNARKEKQREKEREALRIRKQRRTEIEPLLAGVVQGKMSLFDALISAHCRGFVRGRRYELKKAMR